MAEILEPIELFGIEIGKCERRDLQLKLWSLNWATLYMTDANKVFLESSHLT